MKILECIDILNILKNGDILCITTNGCIKKNGNAVMGKGIAKQVADKCEAIPKLLGMYLKRYGNRCFNLGKYKTQYGIIGLATFPTKDNWRSNSNIDIITKSVNEVIKMADKFKWTNIYIPAPGCGCGNLDYEKDVEPILNNLLDDRFTIVFKK